MLTVKQFSSFITFWFFANTEYGSFWVKSERTKTYTNSLKNNKTMVQKKNKKNTDKHNSQILNTEHQYASRPEDLSNLELSCTIHHLLLYVHVCVWVSGCFLTTTQQEEQGCHINARILWRPLKIVPSMVH